VSADYHVSRKILDEPVQFVWGGAALAGVLVTDRFGGVDQHRQPVGADILFRLPISLQLGLMAMIFSLMIGLPVGIISGIRADSTTDQVDEWDDDD